MAWKPGQSGNPAGRARPGTVAARATLRESIAKQMPEVITKLIELAKAGDVSAARCLLERVLPTVRPESLPVTLPTVAAATTATEQAAQVIKAAVSGEIAPDVAADLLAGIANAARIADFDKVADEVRKLREELAR